MALTAVALLVLAGCGDVRSAPSPTAAPDTRRENEVAGDTSATADEIIEAGGPVRVAASENRTLVAWRAQFEDDEGPQQAAWRLYDGDGNRIADGKLGQVVEAGAIPELTRVPDGFLLENYTGYVLRHIDLDASRRSPAPWSTRSSPGSGDTRSTVTPRPGGLRYRRQVSRSRRPCNPRWMPCRMVASS